MVEAYAAYALLADPGALPAAPSVAACSRSSSPRPCLPTARCCCSPPTGRLPSPGWRWWAMVTVAAPVLLVAAMTFASGPWTRATRRRTARSTFPAWVLGCSSPATVWRRLDEWAQPGCLSNSTPEILDRLGLAGRLDWSRQRGLRQLARKRGGITLAQTQSTAASAVLRVRAAGLRPCLLQPALGAPRRIRPPCQGLPSGVEDAHQRMVLPLDQGLDGLRRGDRISMP